MIQKEVSKLFVPLPNPEEDPSTSRPNSEVAPTTSTPNLEVAPSTNSSSSESTSENSATSVLTTLEFPSTNNLRTDLTTALRRLYENRSPTSIRDRLRPSTIQLRTSRAGASRIVRRNVARSRYELRGLRRLRRPRGRYFWRGVDGARRARPVRRRRTRRN